MTQPSGWYDDPNDAEPAALLGRRGVDQPRRAPEVTHGRTSPASGRPRTSPAPRRTAARAGRGSTASRAQRGQQPPGAPPWQGVQLGRPQPTTPDGVLLSGWWRRVAARIVDGVICAVLTALVTFPALGRAAGIMSDFFRASIDAAQSGGTPPPAPVGAGLRPAAGQPGEHRHLHGLRDRAAHLASAPRRAAASWGSACGCAERPGPPPLSAVVRRTFVKEAGSIVGLLPVVGLLGSLFTILDSLWPLWDERRQALHDKAAATNVVLGRSNRAGAPEPRPVAGTTVPVTSPRATRLPSGPGAQPVMVTVSPSCRNDAGGPVGQRSGSWPFQVSSSSDPRVPRVGAADRSPTRTGRRRAGWRR